MGGIAKVFPRDGDIGVRVAAIEQHDGATAVFHLFSPDFGVTVFADAAALHPERILIDGDDFLVGEDFLDVWRHVFQIVSGHERSREHAPEAEVGAVFSGGHAAIADFEHVGIVPMARAGVSFQTDLQIQNLGPAQPIFFAIPTIGDVAGGAPEIADIARPEPGFVAAPFAEAENDRAAGGFQRVAHGGVSGLGVFRAGVAPIVFEVIDAPRSVLQSVLIFVAATAGTLGTSHCSRVGIDAEFQALGMDVVGESLDTGGESFRVGDDVAGGVAADLPAIVNDNVFVAGVLHAAADEGVGGGLDKILVDVAAETVPAVPAHGRSESQTVFQGVRRRNAKKNSDIQDQAQQARPSQASIHKLSPVSCSMVFPKTQVRIPFCASWSEDTYPPGQRTA